MERSGENTPFPLPDDMLLDLNHGSTIVTLVNKLTGIWIASATHVMSCSTASRMGGPGGGVPSPFIPLSRDWHIPAQASPSSTKPASLITESCVYQSAIDRRGQGRNKLLLWRGEH